MLNQEELKNIQTPKELIPEIIDYFNRCILPTLKDRGVTWELVQAARANYDRTNNFSIPVKTTSAGMFPPNPNNLNLAVMEDPFHRILLETCKDYAEQLDLREIVEVIRPVLIQEYLKLTEDSFAIEI